MYDYKRQPMGLLNGNQSHTDQASGKHYTQFIWSIYIKGKQKERKLNVFFYKQCTQHIYRQAVNLARLRRDVNTVYSEIYPGILG